MKKVFLLSAISLLIFCSCSKKPPPPPAATLPVLTTAAITSVNQTSAESGGNISSDGGASITARGICWDTTANPTTASTKTNAGTGTGSFTSMLTGLTVNTLYYVRAYATNSAGTAYGNELSFYIRWFYSNTTCINYGCYYLGESNFSRMRR